MATRRDMIGGPGNGPALEEGANWIDQFQLGTMANANDPVSTLVPDDLTGFTATFKVREFGKGGNDAGGRLILDVTPFITIDGPTGTVAWDVPAASTLSLGFDLAIYAIELTAPDATTSRPLEGSVRYSPRVNR